MTHITEKNKESISQILQGLSYLTREAETNKLIPVRNLLLNTINDIAGWIDNNEQSFGTSSANIMVDTSFMAAIEFLSKFASINDEVLKKEIVDEIRSSESRRTNRSHANIKKIN